MTKDREVLVGVSGGIAAYKTAAMVSTLVQSGIGVSVLMTKASQEFIGKATFAALTGRTVSDSFDPQSHPVGSHITLARQATVFCIAPATANCIAKLAHGIADDLLSTVYLCFTGKVIVAPAMNCEMWEKAAVQRNIEQIKKDGVEVVGPEAGWLSCRQVGHGRMSDPETIIQSINQSFT